MSGHASTVHLAPSPCPYRMADCERTGLGCTMRGMGYGQPARLANGRPAPTGVCENINLWLTPPHPHPRTRPWPIPPRHGCPAAQLPPALLPQRAASPRLERFACENRTTVSEHGAGNLAGCVGGLHRVLA